MSVEVPMPQLGEEATEADVLDWLVAEGESVTAGDVIVELETDKSTVEYEAPVSGTLRKICVAAGTQGVAVGTVLALIDPDDDQPADDAAEAEPRDTGEAPGAEASEADEVDGAGTPPPAASGEAAAAPQAPAAGASARSGGGETASSGPIEVPMPLLGEEMTQADVLDWLVEEGDTIQAGEILVELETDKSTVEYESPVTGVLREIRVPAGTQGVAVGEVLAVIEPSADAGPPRPLPAVEVEPRADTFQGAPGGFQGAPGGFQGAPGGGAPSAATQQPEAPGEGAATTPLARRLAADAGLSVDEIAGSGASGRVLKQDVEAAIRRREADDSAPRPSRPEGAEGPRAEGATEQPLSRMRRTIARRLAESKRTIPHFYLRADCRLDRLLALRAQLNADGDVKISVNDFVVRALALSLIEVPAANVSWGEDVLLQYDRVDVSVAVATPGGLVTPVLREADRKGLGTISSEIRDLASRAREGKLSPKEYQGGSITVSNLGMYGIDSVYPIINPPQSAILGVGQGTAQAVVEDGALAVGTVMTCTLAADHRAVDGAVGAELLAAFRRRVEEPLEMLV